MDRRNLNIDIETYSDVALGKAGLFKYAQSPAFQILLFAYSLDGGPVKVIDLAQGETLPGEVASALFDPNVIKHAYNAAFEWYCLSRCCAGLGVRMTPEEWLPQWRCTMLQGMRLGYPAGLEACGEALGIEQDKRKLSTGRALIRYFSVPCAPTERNGKRTRNLPGHDPEKWELFKTYCGQDVEAELEIGRKLSAYPIPDELR